MSNRELKKNRMLIFFIEAAQKIIDEEGIEGITLRKVADLAGYNSATLYNYFEDLDQLILFASLKYITEYNIEVSKKVKECHSEREILAMMWDTFCNISFRNPKPFYKIFFNKHSENLEEISRQYYELFPEDLATEETNLKCILSGIHLDERNRIELVLIAKEEHLPEEKIDILNEILIALYHDLLNKRIFEKEDEQKAPEYYVNKMMTYYNFILDTWK